MQNFGTAFGKNGKKSEKKSLICYTHRFNLLLSLYPSLPTGQHVDTNLLPRCLFAENFL